MALQAFCMLAVGRLDCIGTRWCSVLCAGFLTVCVTCPLSIHCFPSVSAGLVSVHTGCIHL